MLFTKQIQHLLPRARAWNITAKTRLREFFVGLGNSHEAVREFIDLVYLDLDPQQTRELEAWENQFGLIPSVQTEQERRDRLEAAWSAIGGQSPRYIQDTLQANGFDAYVHDSWDKTALPAIVYHVPGVYLGGMIFYINECGEAVSECGEAIAQCGERLTPPGYALVNKFSGAPVYSPAAVPAQYPHYVYICAEIFGNPAQIPLGRREEFEDLLLEICPAQLWIGVIADYT